MYSNRRLDTRFTHKMMLNVMMQEVMFCLDYSFIQMTPETIQ